jgi:hypothetical protein
MALQWEDYGYGSELAILGSDFIRAIVRPIRTVGKNRQDRNDWMFEINGNAAPTVFPSKDEAKRIVEQSLRNKMQAAIAQLDAR